MAFHSDVMIKSCLQKEIGKRKIYLGIGGGGSWLV